MNDSPSNGGAKEFRESLRSQSEVIGVLLVLGLTITSTTLLVTLGQSAFEDTRDNIEVQNAEKTMTQLDSKASLVAHGSTESQTVELGTGRSGSVEVDETEGTMHVEIDPKSGSTITKTITLGTIRYEQGQSTVAYQGGGVWRQSGGDGGVMVSPPEFDYEIRGDGTPTLTLPLVTVSGEAGSSRSVITQPNPTDVWMPSNSNPNPLDKGKVTITVTSQFNEAWGRFFEERTAGKVSYPTDDTVKVELVIPKSMQTSNALSSSAGSIALDNGGTIDSYNSENSPYSSPGDDEASVAVDGDFDPSNSVTVKGHVRASGDADIKNSIEVYREVAIGGWSEFDNQPVFHGRYSTKEYMNLQSGAKVTVEDDVIVGGDLTGTGELDVQGDLYVGGDATIPGGSDITGDVIAGGSVTVEKDASVGGVIEAGGDVTFESSGSFTTDVISGGTVTVEDKATVTGSIEAAEEVELISRGDVVGNVKATGDTDSDGYSVDIGSDGEIDGDATATGKVDDGDEAGEDGTVTGTVEEDGEAGGVSIQSPSTPVAPLDPNVQLPDPVGSEIDEKGNNLDTDNDNDDVSAIDGSDSLQNCGGTCTLPSGNYYLSDVDLDSGDTLELDTSGGDIHVYVDDDLDIDDGTVEITGDEKAVFYVNDDFTISGGDVVNPDDRSSQFWILMRPSESATIKGDSVFKGVVYGPPSNTEPGVSVTVQNNPVVYGAIVGSTSSTSNNNVIHYDEALEDYAAVSGSSAPQVTYLHISVTEVEIENG